MQQCAITDVYANKCTKNLYALIDRAVTQDMSVMPWEKLNNILKSQVLSKRNLAKYYCAVWRIFLTCFWLNGDWRLETSSRFCYCLLFTKMTIKQDLVIFNNSWHLPFLNLPYPTFQKKLNTGILTQLITE